MDDWGFEHLNRWLEQRVELPADKPLGAVPNRRGAEAYGRIRWRTGRSRHLPIRLWEGKAATPRRRLGGSTALARRLLSIRKRLRSADACKRSTGPAIESARVNDFFKPPPTQTTPEPQRYRMPPWFGAPRGTLPGVVALERVVVHTDKVAICLTRLAAYPTGFEVIFSDEHLPLPPGEGDSPSPVTVIS
jgi:hypothetical protein